MRITVAPIGKRYLMVGRFGFTQAERDGRLVLKEEKHWTKINGFFINTNRGCYWFEFRRYF